MVKSRIWSKDRADVEFSKYVRTRDKQCLYPNCTETDRLQNSHFVGRARNATRFYPDNCIALCYKHHYGDKLLGFEYQKQIKEKHGYDGQYTKFMKRYLGASRYRKLMERGQTTMSQSSAIIECMELLGKL